MTPQSLKAQAEEFACQMQSLVERSVSDDVQIDFAVIGDALFSVRNKGREEQSIIASTVGDPIPLAGSNDLYLHAAWTFIPNSSGRWLKTNFSKFSLSVRKQNRQLVPSVRLEVDNRADSTAWAAAHIHVTAESTLLGYIRGLKERPYAYVQDLHLPVGGFRYRPCLEDFIEFLAEDDLISVKDGWRQVLDETRAAYRKSQFISLVPRYEPDAVEALQRMGYTIESPSR